MLEKGLELVLELELKPNADREDVGSELALNPNDDRDDAVSELALNPNEDREDIGSDDTLPAKEVTSALGIGSLRVEPIASR